MSALAPMLPHLLVALVAVGMALAFLLADGRAPTSRALALALSSIGVGIVVNFGYIQLSAPESVPGWAGWLALPEALAMAAFLEWLLRVRRTIPSGKLDVRGGDGVIRLGQVAALVYLVESLLWPELRVQQFYGAARYGAQGLRVLAVNVDSKSSDAETFLAQFPDLGFGIALDSKGATPATYQIKGMPTSFLIGPDGTVLLVQPSFKESDREALQAQLAAAVAANGKGKQP